MPQGEGGSNVINRPLAQPAAAFRARQQAPVNTGAPSSPAPSSPGVPGAAPPGMPGIYKPTAPVLPPRPTDPTLPGIYFQGTQPPAKTKTGRTANLLLQQPSQTL